MAFADAPPGSTLLVRKIALVAWIGLWVALALLTFERVRDLRSLATTLDRSATALDTAGSGLEAIGAVPVIGQAPARLGREVRATAVEARTSAAETRSTIDSVSILAAVVVLGATVTPAVVAYRSSIRLHSELEDLRSLIRDAAAGR